MNGAHPHALRRARRVARYHGIQVVIHLRTGRGTLDAIAREARAAAHAGREAMRLIAAQSR